MIHARHIECGEEACERVVRVKVWKWLGTDSEDYLRPETLFRPTKFDAYANERPPSVVRMMPYDPHSPADMEAKRVRREKVYGRISPERRTAGISYCRHTMREIEADLARLEFIGRREGQEESSAVKRDALSKKLEELRGELAFLEAGKEEGE
jgi:hypothetical protein